MTTTPADVKSIFGKALERPDPAGRAAYLAEACGGDDALRAEVDGLLAALDEAGAFLNRPGVTETFGPPQPAATADFPGDNESVGCVIAGRYKLVEEIGEGGMGTVWMAQQTEPVRRAVAVKVIKAGMDSKAVLARFEAERQALAMMDHPNIAKVLDAGATDSGRPFFVMELVKGVPITKFCDERKLTPRGRLELFVPVCQAIQHAHQKGVIHRDIKPSNVLVALYDDRPVPKVIDFGVAKAAGQSLTDKTLMTGFGAVVGTPEYMSPEQASFNQMDVDTRSDIYALGVLLYELLTGATPVDRRSMEKAAFLEVLRIVREVEPPRPSTKLSSDAALPSIAANRGIEPGKLANLLRGELDWVVMKALEKDRSRRYDTANGLVRDIQRYLADEVVEARPPSAGYRVRKFVRRNKGRAVAASLILAALAGGVVVATLGLVRAEHARRAEVAQRLEAVRERDEKEQARADAVAEKDRAEREKRRADEESAMAKAVNEFLQKDLLGRVGEGGFAGGPNVPPDPNVTARALLDRAAEGIGDRFRDQPAVEAALRQVIGQSYSSLGHLERSLPHWRRAAELKSSLLGRGHSEALLLWLVLAEQTAQAGRKDDAVRILDDVRGLIEPESSLPPKDRASLLRRLATNYRQCGRPGDAKRLTERLLEVKGLPDRLRTEQDIADAIAAVNSLRDIGRPGDADRMFEQAKQAALRMEREAHPDAERALWAVGSDLYGQRDRSAEAIPFLERAREVWLRKHGPDRPLPYMYLNLVYAYMEVGRPADAIPILEKLCRRTPEGARYGTLNEQFVLSVCYRRAGRPGDAVPVLERVRDTYVAAQGMDGKDALAMALHLGDTYSKLGWFAESVKQLEEALPKFRTTYGMDNSLTRGSMRNLAEGYDQLGKPAKAEPLRRELVDYARTKFGPDHGETLDALARRGLCLVRAGRVEDGLRDAEELAATATGPGLYNAACVYSRAAERIDRATARERDAARALDLLRQAAAKGQNDPMELVGDDDLDAIRDRSEFAALLKEIGAKQPTVYGNALAKLGTTLLQKQKWTRAEPLLRECLAIRETTLPDDWRTFNARALLGGSLLGQTKSAAAKPLLLAGYAGMKQRADTIPNFAKACLPAAAVRLVQLYEATGQPAEAAKWLDEAWAWAETPGEM